MGVNRIIQSPLRAHWRPGCFPAQCAAAGWQLHDLPEPLENPAVRPGIHPRPSSLSAEWAVAGLLVGPWCWAVHEEELGQRHGHMEPAPLVPLELLGMGKSRIQRCGGILPGD